LRLYFDTAYIAKCYLTEPDGEKVRELARSASGLCSSALCVAEIACVFHRQVREGSLDASAAAFLRKYFRNDLKNQVWELIPVTDHLLNGVEDLIKSLPTGCFIRAGDAIHVASAIEFGFQEIWSNDRHLLAAANHAGLRGRSV
jgi:predicted nucleic acid-binding protein